MCRGLALPYSLSGAVNSPIPDTRDAGISPQTAPMCWPRSSCSNKVYKYQSDRVHIARSQPGCKNHRSSSGFAALQAKGERKGDETTHQTLQCPGHREAARVGARLGMEPDLCCSARLQRARLGVGRARHAPAELQACGSAGCSNPGL